MARDQVLQLYKTAGKLLFYFKPTFTVHTTEHKKSGNEQ
jgi:hypothetical protein